MDKDGFATARQLWALLEPIHAVTYFSPEPIDALKEAGYRGFWMGYFAGRAAPLGAVGPELVHALFYNFDFGKVTRAVPDAWTFAPPEAALQARVTGSVAALRRQLGAAADGDGVRLAADLAIRAATQAPLEGRPLHAANRSLPVPNDPLARLWHAATLLREHRGDGHVAALLTSGVSGRTAHVLQAVSRGIPKAVYELARDFDDKEWRAELSGLRDLGYVDDSDRLTPAGEAVTADIEMRTNSLAATAYAVLETAELGQLLDVLRPITAAVVKSGDIPSPSPMGLDLAEAGEDHRAD